MKILSIIFLILTVNCRAQCDQIRIQAEANGASAYFFSASVPIISSDGLEIILDRTDVDSILVHLVAISDFGCKTESDTMLILEPCIVDLWIPNSFTPNGDGINDNFFPNTKQEYQMTIFNRWGEVLFIGKIWDGSYRGAIIQDGVYGWEIILKKRIIHGRVTLLMNN